MIFWLWVITEIEKADLHTRHTFSKDADCSRIFLDMPSIHYRLGTAEEKDPVVQKNILVMLRPFKCYWSTNPIPLNLQKEETFPFIPSHSTVLYVYPYFKNTQAYVKQRECFNTLFLWLYVLSLIPFAHLLYCQSPSPSPTVLRDRIWIHKLVSAEVPNTCFFVPAFFFFSSCPALPSCSRWLQKGKPHSVGLQKGNFRGVGTAISWEMGESKENIRN